VNRDRLLTVHRTETIGACISAAYDHDTLAGSQNFEGRIDRVAVAAFVLLGKKLHREMDAA
jgi:hypothetical protein